MEKTPINAELQGRNTASVASDEQQPTTSRSTPISKGSEKPMKWSERGSSGTYPKLQNKK